MTFQKYKISTQAICVIKMLWIYMFKKDYMKTLMNDQKYKIKYDVLYMESFFWKLG